MINRSMKISSRWALLTSILVGAILLSGCGGKKEAPPRQAPPVTVASPTLQDIRTYAIFTGSSRAVQSADVVARVAGCLETVEFEPSSDVVAGDLLFTIEDTKYKADRDVAVASVQSAKADLLRAETELKRVEKASESRAVSEMDVDRARAGRDMALAAVALAQANLSEAELNLSYTQVVAPIAGVVSRNLVDAGNLVGQGGNTMLTRVNTLRPIHVYFHVPESLVLKYLNERKTKTEENVAADKPRSGGVAQVALANDTGFPHEGFIDYVDNEVDPNTGTIEMRVSLKNEDMSLFPGLFVRVKLQGKAIADAVLVPETALGTDLGGKYILTVGENNIVKLNYVELGARQAGGLIHVRSGVGPQDTIIIDGLMFARPGMPVMPLTAEQFAAKQKEAAGKIAAGK